MKLVFDLESDGLLREATIIWCIVLKNLETGHVDKCYSDGDIYLALKALEEAKIIIGHNICGFDIPLIKKLHPDFEVKGKIRDTLCMSKLFDPDRQLHSLESYGLKFGRAKPEHDDWSAFSHEMLHRCAEDVEINTMLYKYLVDKECKGWDWVEAIELEQAFAADQAQQELNGVDIDIGAATKLIERLDTEIAIVDSQLYRQLPYYVKNKGPVNKPFKKDGSYSKMVTDWIGVVNEDTDT